MGTAGRGGDQPIEGSEAGPCRVEAPLRRLTELQVRNAIQDLWKGAVGGSDKFPAGESGASRTGFSHEPDANVVTTLGAEKMLDAAEEVALGVIGKLPQLLPCATAPGEDCARTFIRDYGARAFRRPLGAEEETTLIDLYRKAEGADAFKDGIALVATALMQSPQFLYVVDRGQPLDGDDSVVELDQHAVASRLSFLMWDAPPDQDLLDAAAAGRLGTRDEVRAQAERMLGDRRARAMVHRFAFEWTRLETLKGSDRTAAGWSDQLAADQRRELELFAEDAFLGDGTLTSLLTSRSTFANQAIADLYGVDSSGLAAGHAPEDFARIDVGDDARAGILTLPAIMASKAHTDEPAYVFRGTFVLGKLMCVDLPVPPAGAAEMLPAFPANATQRQKSDLIRGVDDCSACHDLIDPIGLSFEGFDEIGRTRDTLPNGERVDTSGAVRGVSDKKLQGDFDRPAELAARLAASPQVASCMARQMFRFAFARLDGTADRCAVDGLVSRLGETGGSLRELVLGLTELEGFRYRKLGGAR
jgi:hypothetical protein